MGGGALPITHEGGAEYTMLRVSSHCSPGIKALHSKSEVIAFSGLSLCLKGK